MNNLTLNTLTNHKELTISTREIAELCNKRHDNVLQICRELKAKSISPKIQEIKSLDKLGRSYPEFLLNKRDSTKSTYINKGDNMYKLINISNHTINNQKVNTVNARELHEFLEVQTRFNDWIKLRIEKYEFIENTDYITLTKNLVSGGKATEYFITLDMAKELAMVENNLKGKQARKYFIEVEKQFKEQTRFKLPSNYLEALEQLTKEVKEKTVLEQELALAKPKLNYLEEILQSKSLVNINQIAKDYGYSAKAFNQLLASLKIQYKQNGQWLLYAEYHNKGYVFSNTIDIKHTDGTKTTVMHTMWTQKGRMFLYDKLKNKGIPPLIERDNFTPIKLAK